MSIMAVPVSRGLAEYHEISHLMKTAFSKNEQLQMFILKLLALRKDVSFHAFYNDADFCGLLYAYTAENKKYAFVLYLAVNENIRSKGYGGQILEWLKKRTSKNIVLNVEEVCSSATNAEQREKRIAFYQRNGITDTGYTFSDGGEKYAVLASDPEHFDVQEYEKLLKSFSLGLYRRRIVKR